MYFPELKTGVMREMRGHMVDAAIVDIRNDSIFGAPSNGSQGIPRLTAMLAE
jgi:hypothetical protein